MFGDYIYVIVYAGMPADVEEILHEKINKQIGKWNRWFWFFKRRMKSFEHYNEGNKMFQMYLTFLPNTKREFYPFIYRFYAFTKTNDRRILESYKHKVKTFSEGEYTMEVYKIKL